MCKLILGASDEDHSGFDCFGLAVLTHGGDQGVLYGSDDNITYVKNLLDPILDCPSLAGKPKICFIQACRGSELDEGIEPDSDFTGKEEDPLKPLPTDIDTLYAYSTPPGFFAWRSMEYGSWFIQSLCEQLSMNMHNARENDMDLVSILTLVNRQVATAYESRCESKPSMHAKKQVPSSVSMLTKELYLVPMLPAADSSGGVNKSGVLRYPMHKPMRGKFIIISNETFMKRPPRTGSKTDAAELKNVFEALGFQVDIHKNKTSSEMLQLMLRASEESQLDWDCFGAAVLTLEGSEQGMLYGVDDSEITVKNFVQMFKTCKNLVGKPKIFFFQTCIPNVYQSEDDGGKGSGTPRVRLPLEADFLYVYSTLPGSLVWDGKDGDVNKCSWFVESLSHHLTPSAAATTDLLRILTKVKRQMAEKCESKKITKRVPSVVSMLTKDLYFTAK